MYIFFAVPVPPVDLTSDIPCPVPRLSSPTLTCIVDLGTVNVRGLLVLRWTGPGSFTMSATQVLTGAEVSFERTAMLNDIDFGSGDGEYTCSAQLFITELGGFIIGSGVTGSDSTIIEVQGTGVEFGDLAASHRPMPPLLLLIFQLLSQLSN